MNERQQKLIEIMHKIEKLREEQDACNICIREISKPYTDKVRALQSEIDNFTIEFAKIKHGCEIGQNIVLRSGQRGQVVGFKPCRYGGNKADVVYKIFKKDGTLGSREHIVYGDLTVEK